MNYSESWAQGLDAMNSLGLWMTWATPGRDLKALDVMNNLELYEWYEQLRIPWVQVSRWYELLKALVEVNNSRSWAQGSRCHEQVRVMNDMNDSGSLELRPLDALNYLW